MFNKKLIKITQQIVKGEECKNLYEKAWEIATLDREYTFDLLICANKIREKFKNSRVFTCSIINAKSGSCSQDCAFCAQSSFHKTGVKKYPLMKKDEMVDLAVKMHNAGATRFSIVTSGLRLSGKEIETICLAAEKIKHLTNLSLCASIGMINESDAKKLLESGISRYHHNLETSESFFDHICTTHDYKEDISAVQSAAAAGLKVCSGGIMGLGESWKQRVELACTLRDLDVDSIPINFLNPVAGTKMEGRPLLSPMDALKCIAMFRLVNPKKDITVCGGREAALKDFQSWLFFAGANGLMAGNYLTTMGRDTKMDMAMLKDMGLYNENR